MIYILFWFFVIYTCLRFSQKQYLKRKYGCKSPAAINYGILNHKFIKESKKHRDAGDLLEVQLQHFRNSGKHTLQSLYGLSNLVLTCNGENMKAALATQFNDFSIGYRPKALSPLIGHGIFASEGERWKISREMLRPQFIREQISHTQNLEPHFQNFATKIRQYRGQKIDLQSLFHDITIDSSSEFLFGESTGTLLPVHDNQFQFAEAFNQIQDHLTNRLMLGPFYFLIHPKEMDSGINRIHNAVRYYVQKALEATPEEIEEKSKSGYVFLYELVKKTRDPKILQDELLSILLAGRNTTASLLSFLFYELSLNPEVWGRLKEEVHKNFGSGENVQFDKITFESMKRCTYLKYCINEALRLHPPVSRNSRCAIKDTTLPKGGGPDGESPIFLPKGSQVLLHIFSVHRQLDVYGKDADIFRPERWEQVKPGWSFMPFGSGPRICLGQQFALTEASYFTIRILQTFPDLTGYLTEYPPKRLANATMKLMDGVTVSLN